MIKKILNFFDKFEDYVRKFLSKYPIAYALIGGIGIVLFWRAIWGLSEDIGLSNLDSLFISTTILLATGLFVSYFIGDQFIISGIRGEKKIIEKTKEEILNEEAQLKMVIKKLNIIENKIDELVDEDKK